MEQFDLQVMLKDGSFADFLVQTERDSGVYEVFRNEERMGVFTADDDGSFSISDRQGGPNEDLESRIIEQLKGYRT